MARAPGNEEYDPRNHRSVLIPGYVNECLNGLPPEKVPTAVSLIQEAEEFQDDELRAYCYRYLATDAGSESKRVRVMAGIAVHDEAMRIVEAENRRGPRDV